MKRRSKCQCGKSWNYDHLLLLDRRRLVITLVIGVMQMDAFLGGVRAYNNDNTGATIVFRRELLHHERTKFLLDDDDIKDEELFVASSRNDLLDNNNNNNHLWEKERMIIHDRSLEDEQEGEDNNNQDENKEDEESNDSQDSEESDDEDQQENDEDNEENDNGDNDEQQEDDQGEDNENNQENEQDNNEEGGDDNTEQETNDDYYAFDEDPVIKLLPLSASDILAFSFASLGVTLAAGGGIGGGGIVVPCYILILGFSPREAIPLSAVTVLGGAAASTLINARKRHPLADRPMIDWNLVLVMEPLILVGALLGTLLHRMLSEKLLVVLLVGLLSVTAHTTLHKAKRMWDAETVYIERLKKLHLAALQRQQEEQETYKPPTSPPNNENHTMQQVQVGDEERSVEESCSIEAIRTDITGPRRKDQLYSSRHHRLDSNIRQQILILNPDFVSLRSDMLEEEKVTPGHKIMALIVMISVLTFLNVMMGGGAFYSPWGIRCGSLAFWVVQICMAALMLASAWAAQTYLVNRHEIKELIHFDYVHGDIRWDSKGAILYPPLFCCAGVFAGMFGIGGGMICVPLLLTMGVHPMVSTATSSCMILFTSFSSTTSFVIFGLLMWDYALVCLAVGFLPTLLGQLLMAQARWAGTINGQNFERNSIIAYSIGGVVLLSALLMTLQYVFSIVRLDERADTGGLCEGYQRGSV